MNGHPRIYRSGQGRLALLSLVVLLLVAPLTAAAADPAADLRDRAILALGGADRLARVQAIDSQAHAINFSAMYNEAADGPPIHLSNETTESVFLPQSGRYRITTRLEGFHPFPGAWRFVRAFDGEQGYRDGPADFLGDGPAQLATAHAASYLKRLWLMNPHWILLQAEGLSPAGGTRLSVSAMGETWSVAIGEDGLPRWAEVTETHGFFGHVTVRVVYDDWRAVDGVMLPFRLVRSNDGVPVRRVVRETVTLNEEPPDVDWRSGYEGRPETGGDVDAQSHGWRMSHWYLGRTAMGRGTVTGAPKLSLDDLGGDVYRIAGRTHHGLAVVGDAGILVVDAPFYPAHGQAMLDLLAQRWPDRPVTHLALTHHHLDHAGGYLPFVEAGATLVVPAGNAGFFRRAIARANPRLSPGIISVTNRKILDDIGRPVDLLHVPNAHSQEMLAVHVPDRNLLFVTDLFSPGRPTTVQNVRYAKALRHALRYHGVGVETISGGHGAPTAPIDDLVAAAARSPE